VFLALVLVFVQVSGAFAAASLITATDLLKLKQLESPALSPDGKWVVYVVRSIEPKTDAPGEAAAKTVNKEDWTYHTNLWLAATDGSTPPRQLTRGTNAAAPTWSPQGDRIAFVRSAGEKEKPQIWILPFGGGEATPLTKVETGASAPRWSPDGTKILFTSSLNYAQVRAALEKAGQPTAPAWSVERPGRAANDTQNYGAKKSGAAKSTSEKSSALSAKADPSAGASAKADGTLTERREWLAQNEADNNPRTLTRLNFLSEFDITAEQAFTHVFVQDVREGAEATDLTPGFTSYAGAEWLADGRGLVVAGPADRAVHPDRVRRFALYRVGLDGSLAPLLDFSGHSVGNPQPSPDGKWIAFTAVEGEAFATYNQAAVAIMPAAGGEPRVLTAEQDRSPGNLAWSPDSRRILYTVATMGRFPVCSVTPDGKERYQLTWQKDWGIRDFAIGDKGLAQIVTHPGNPSELHYGTREGKISRPITTHNASWIAERRLSPLEEGTLKNELGQSVQYWTIAPTAAEPGKKYPLLLQIHGGPAAMWGPGEESMWFEFQFFAAQGYAIVFANPRGSGGYGRAFQAANYRDWGKGPAADVLAAASEAAKLPYVDASRQVITGGSYGGYLTAWIVGHDQRFKAAVAQRGVYELNTFFGEGNAWRLVPLAWGGLPWERGIRDILTEQSPLTYVESIQTPLLIQHGDNDRRTGFVQSEMLLKSLKLLGRDVESVRYPRATHEMSRSGEPKQRLDSLVRYEEFFRRYVGEN
jgi:dipeptidyl aminopeptidase/acylaminoacyl peptidase